jgi:hypothetical protein
MIERHAADQLFDHFPGRIFAQTALLFSANDARRAVDQTHDHRADANQIKLFFVHRSNAGLGRGMVTRRANDSSIDPFIPYCFGLCPLQLAGS